MGTPLISVVIPTHNREHTIGYSLGSVLAQSYPPFEIIIVDDGSTDNTVKKILEYDDPRIRLVRHLTSKGAQAARNTGIRSAQGQWIAFLDSDDEWNVNKLERQIAALSSRGWQENIMVHSDMTCYYPKSGKKENWDLPLMDGKSCYIQLLRSPGPLFPTFFVSKNALKAIGYLDESVLSYQEWDTAIRLAKICEFIHIREPLAVYWIHEGDAISKNKRRDVEGYRYILKKHQPAIEELLGYSGWYRHWAILANRYAKFGFFTDALQMIGQMPRLSYWRFIAYLLFFKTYIKKLRREPL